MTTQRRAGSRSRPDNPRRQLVLTVSSAVFASLAAIVTVLVNLRDTIPYPYLGVIGGVLGVSLSLIFLALLRQVRVIPLTIALAGPPRAGKTAFANSLYSELMDGRIKSLSFVSETESAIFVSQMMQSARDTSSWPPATTKESLRLYRGRLGIGKVRASILDAALGVFRRRVEYDLELGDSAGENWQELASEGRGDRPRNLVDSSFFQYIVNECDILLYFVPADEIVLDPARVRASVNDLTVTLRLLRSVQGGDAREKLRMPVGLVISKADLLSSDQLDVMRRLTESGSIEFSRQELDGVADENLVFLESVDQIEKQMAVLARTVQHTAYFYTSAALTLFENRPRVAFQPLSDLLEPSALSRYQSGLESLSERIGDPLRWAIKQSLFRRD